MLVCVGCQREMKCSEIGAFVRTMPCAVRACDIYRCPICGVQIATEFADKPLDDSGRFTTIADLTAERGE